MKKKNLFVSAIAIVLVLCCAIGGTLAWLMDKDSKINTFTVGNIDITLDETTGDTYKILPGKDIEKDPKVTVKAGSEKCYVFVEIEEKNFSDKLTYAIAEGWTQLADNDNVYYQVVDTSKEAQEFFVLEENKVHASENLTKEDLEEMGKNAPKLTFNAYAIQFFNGEDNQGKETNFTPKEAWTEVSTQSQNA